MCIAYKVPSIIQMPYQKPSTIKCIVDVWPMQYLQMLHIYSERVFCLCVLLVRRCKYAYLHICVFICFYTARISVHIYIYIHTYIYMYMRLYIGVHTFGGPRVVYLGTATSLLFSWFQEDLWICLLEELPDGKSFKLLSVRAFALEKETERGREKAASRDSRLHASFSSSSLLIACMRLLICLFSLLQNSLSGAPILFSC